MLPRTLYTSDHEAFRLEARKFLEREAQPRMESWEVQGHPDREFWQLAGSKGFLGYAIPREYGGLGADRRHGAILLEVIARSFQVEGSES